MYAVVKTVEEADQLNEYIKNWYLRDVDNSQMEKWTDVITIDSGFAVEILESWKNYPVPDFIINGISFEETIENSLSSGSIDEIL
jgi:hypothetical protein